LNAKTATGGERSLLFFGLFLGVPTGDADRDLGAGHLLLEPTVLWLLDFGKGNYFQSRFSWEIPVDVDDPTNEFRYDTGLYHTFTSTEDSCVFRFFTLAFEANGVTALNTTESSHTTLDLTTGVRWVARDADEVGLGWSFPVTGNQNFGCQFIFSYRVHF